jgi:hypothetical protein
MNSEFDLDATVGPPAPRLSRRQEIIRLAQENFEVAHQNFHDSVFSTKSRTVEYYMGVTCALEESPWDTKSDAIHHFKRAAELIQVAEHRTELVIALEAECNAITVGMHKALNGWTLDSRCGQHRPDREYLSFAVVGYDKLVDLHDRLKDENEKRKAAGKNELPTLGGPSYHEKDLERIELVAALGLMIAQAALAFESPDEPCQELEEATGQARQKLNAIPRNHHKDDSMAQIMAQIKSAITQIETKINGLKGKIK